MEDPIASRTLLDAGRVLDHAPVGFCIFDADQHCVYANPWLLDALGVEATAIHGRDIDDVLAGADRPLGASIAEVIGSGTDLRPKAPSFIRRVLFLRSALLMGWHARRG